MSELTSDTRALPGAKVPLFGLVVLGLVAFSALFVLIDNSYYTFANARFPNVGTSAWLATLWGVVSRAHLLICIIPLVLWQPHLFGFQIGKTWQHWRMVLVMLLANCGVIAASAPHNEERDRRHEPRDDGSHGRPPCHRPSLSLVFVYES